MRVADFGLARALAEASWTEPAGALFGTARYASPEQATGVQLDARSDLYSLALVLVESVTGRLPFAADTTLGMLTARTLQPLVATEELGPLAAGDRSRRRDRSRRSLSRRGARCARRSPTPPTRCRRPARSLLAGMVDRADPHPDARRGAGRRAPLFDQDAVESCRRPRRGRTRSRATEAMPRTANARPGSGGSCRGSSRSC